VAGHRGGLRGRGKVLTRTIKVKIKRRYSLYRSISSLQDPLLYELMKIRIEEPDRKKERETRGESFVLLLLHGRRNIGRKEKKN